MKNLSLKIRDLKHEQEVEISHLCDMTLPTRSWMFCGQLVKNGAPRLSDPDEAGAFFFFDGGTWLELGPAAELAPASVSGCGCEAFDLRTRVFFAGGSSGGVIASPVFFFAAALRGRWTRGSGGPDSTLFLITLRVRFGGGSEISAVLDPSTASPPTSVSALRLLRAIFEMRDEKRFSN
jgi:hypothetical protein